MLFSYKWLKEYFNEDLPKPEKLVELLTVNSFEIEGMEGDGDDSVIDIDILPNRAHDALCHYGMAHEVATVTGLPLKEIDFDELAKIQKQNLAQEKSKIDVKVSGDFCRRYIAREIKNIKVGPSPKELVEKLEAIDQRSINNIVDITNIVMFELNQPMHAFDLEKLDGNINVRPAKDGEHITTLDNQEIDLDSSMPVIADDKEVLAIAGVKGGKKAEVGVGTQNIVLESANFDSVVVRKTSQKSTVKTESSKRFENGITPEIAHKAIARSTELILKYASTEDTIICQDVDYYPNPAEQNIIEVNIMKVNSLLGVELSVAEASAVLSKLNFAHKIADKKIKVEIPFERIDLVQEVDVIEEIGRIYGYDNIPDQEITEISFQPKINPEYFVNSLLRKILIEIGYSETINYSFVDSGVLSLEKPLAEDKKYLRTSLREGMIKSLELNQKSADWLGLDQVKIFEIGKVFDGKPNDYFEKAKLGLGVMNKQGIKKPKAGTALREAVEKISTELEIKIDVKINEDQDNFIEIDLGKVYKEINQEKVLKEKYLDFPPAKNNSYKAISNYPFILRDIAVWIPTDTDPQELVSIIKENSGELLIKEPRQFDAYQKDERTSYAYRLVFQSFEKTLTDVEINEIMTKISSQIESKGWEIR